MKKISVLAHKVQEIKKRLTKLNKKLVKKNLPGMMIEVSSPYDVEVYVDPSDYRPECKIKVKYVDLTIHHDIPTLKEKGYEFLATISHKHDTKTIFNNTDENFFEMEIDFLHCDHCNIRRERNIVSLFRKIKTGKLVQIGSTCVKEYFGLDLVNALTAGCEFLSYVRSPEFDRDPNYWNNAMEFNMTLAASVLVLRHDKRYIPNDTASYTMELVFDTVNGKTKELINYMNTEDWKELSEKIYNYWDELNPSSDFEYNIKERFISRNVKSIALIACGAFNMLKPEFEANKKESENRLNEHIGTKGETLEANIRVIKEIPYNGFYGQATILMMRTDTGHTLKWFTTSYKLGLNDEKRIRFRVKDHDEWNGYKNTIITRARII